MAAAYYDAIAEFIAGRQFGARYEPLADPAAGAAVAKGASLHYGIRLTNTSLAPAAGWTLEARLVPAALLYDGSNDPGELVGSAAVPSVARAGQVGVGLDFVAPASGNWLVKFDVRLADGRHLSELGIPVLQLPLSVAAR